MKIAFFGTPRFAQIVLAKLADSPYKPTLVVTSPDAKVGRGQTRQTSPVKKTAFKNNIEVLQPESLLDKNFKFQTFVSEIAILVAYRKIIPKEILQIPKYGFINVHPSLLPKYRGPSPIQSAILAGEEKTGVTIMLLDEKVDHGPILAQKEVEIKKTDTHESLIVKLGIIGSDLLIEVLPYYMAGDLKAKPQDHSQTTFTKQIKKADGFVDLQNPPDPATFERLIRAFYPWPGVWTRLPTTDNRLLTIKFLPGNLIQPEGKRVMTLSEFKNGYPNLSEKISNLINLTNSRIWE